MIFRKPYAFLIKNFKKIHIVMLILTIFIYFKLNDILDFIRDYINFGTYNKVLEPFSKEVGILFYLAIILILVISILLIVLLYRKKKPWKIYLVYVFEYIMILGTVIGANGFFNNYTDLTSVSGILIYRDTLNICKYIQFIVFILLLIRILGIDIKNFDFKKDEEFLELSQDDREEFEISFEFDKNSINRYFNLTVRHIKYYYLEHKFFCNALMGVLCVILLFNSYRYFMTHRSYSQNKTFNSGIYSITVKDSYITDKDQSGNVIEDNTKFVVVVINMKNNINESVEPNLSRFHLMNKNTDKIYTTYYNNYFKDLGSGADSKITIPSGSSKEFYLVFKEKEELKNNKFVLYYQELGGALGSYLRKIKLKLNDVTDIEKIGDYKVNDKITFTYPNNDKKINTITSYDVNNEFNYYRYICISDSNCAVRKQKLSAKSGEKLLKISFASSDFEGEEFIDFSKIYGKIKYIDNSGKTKYAKVVDAVDMDYQGKEIFIRAKEEILDSKKLSIVYTLRNKQYILNLK